MLRRATRSLMLAGVLVLAACDYTYGPMNLKPGASIDEVRRQMGAATDEKKNPDGARVWWYVRGPQGFHTYKIVFDKDDRIATIAQVLTEANFRNIVPGKSTKQDVLELIGRPREQQGYPNRAEEVWTWLYQDGTFNKYLHVSFALDGVARNYEFKDQGSLAP